VEPHETFRREGEHLYSQIEIGLAQAALGTEMDVETIDGTETVRIEKGTQAGDMITLKEKGVPHLRRQGRGNHYIELRVVTPQRLTQKQEELLRAFAKEAGENVSEPKDGLLKRFRKKKK
jgi:molecular chaperone DnaJ